MFLSALMLSAKAKKRSLHSGGTGTGFSLFTFLPFQALAELDMREKGPAQLDSAELVKQSC